MDDKRRKGKNSALVIFLVFMILSMTFFRVITINSGFITTATSVTETKNALVDGNFSATLQEVGQYRNRYGGPIDVAVQDDLAFVACKPGELLIFNVSDPTAPTLLSSFNEERPVSLENRWDSNYSPRIEVSGTIAILADGYNGLLFLDVAEPTKPVLLSKFPGGIQYLSVQGTFAYIVTQGTAKISYGNVFRIIDFSDPKKPFMTGEINRTQTGGFYYELVVSEHYVYVSVPPEVVIIDVVDPFHPKEVASIDIRASSLLKKVSNFLLVEQFRGGIENAQLKVVNISNPLSPELVATYETSLKGIIEMAIFNRSVVFLSGYKVHSIITVDITNITNPIEISKFKNPLGSNFKIYGMGFGSNSSEKVLYCADYYSGLYCLNFSNLSQLTLISAFGTNGLAGRLAVEGNYAYLCSQPQNAYYPSRLEIINIANTSAPKLVGSYQYPQDAIMDIVVSEGYAYLAIAKEGLDILDVRDPTNPKLVGQYRFEPEVGNFRSLVLDKKYQRIYLAHDWHDLFIIDCSAKTNPQLYWRIAIAEPLFALGDIFLDGEYLYLTSIGSGILAIVDINYATPVNPVALSWLYFPSRVNAIYVRGDVIFLCNDWSELRMIDAKNKSAPLKIARLSNGWGFAQALTVEGNYAYIAQYAGGLRVVDITNPSELTEVAAVRDHYRGLCYDVVYHEGLIFIADGWDGLEIYRLNNHEPKEPSLYVVVFIPITTSFFVVTILLIRENRRKK
ncbi:MAG: hypothetical protein K9W42_05605 [Candidatus Heimdallarchaeota archaeon]|nr:hypothetical protein [Candidatus Heimdallarchaeota archaeon]